MASYYERGLATNAHKSPVVYKIEDGGCWRCLSHAEHPSSGHAFFYRRGRTVRIGTHLFHLENPDKSDRTIHGTCGNAWCINPAHHRACRGGRSRKFTDRQVERIRYLATECLVDRHDLAAMFDTNAVTISHVINSKGAYAQ